MTGGHRSHRFALPDLGEGIAEAVIVRWHVEPGQSVREGDPLLDVETDKAIVAIPSPQSGRVGRLEAEEGATVPVGALLLVIEVESAEAPAPADGQTRVPAESKAPVREDHRSAAPGSTREGDAGEGGTPLGAVRRRLVRHLTRVQREVPAVTVVEECDFTALEETLVGFERTAFLLKAVSTALALAPELNATFDDEIVLHERHDIGLAVQGAEALVVPVVRDVAGRSLGALADDVRRLTDGVRQNRLAPNELRGSTFTVTDAGPFGGLFATPLVSAPEVAVLGVHRVDDRPVVRSGEVVIRRVGYVSCSFDQRAVDDFQVGPFLQRFAELVRRPDALPRSATAVAE